MKGHKLDLQRTGMRPWLEYHPRCLCGWTARRTVHSVRHARVLYRDHLPAQKCLECGAAFDRTPTHPTQVYCSRPCMKRNGQRRRMRELRAKVRAQRAKVKGDWLTVQELGELVRLERSAAYKLARRIGVKVGPRAVRISRRALKEFLAAGGYKADQPKPDPVVAQARDWLAGEVEAGRLSPALDQEQEQAVASILGAP